MVGKSDLVILIVSSSLLAGGLLLWRNNLSKIAQAPRIPQAPNQIQASPPLVNDTMPQASSQTPLDSVVHGNIVDANTSTESLNSDSAAAELTHAEPDARQAVASSSSTSAETASSDKLNDNSAPALDEQPLYGTYVVQRGDSLSKIANRYDSTVELLQRINNISGSLIEVDQKIFYPLPIN